VSEFCERVVKQRIEGRWLWYRITLIAIYVALALILLSLALSRHIAFLALLPLLGIPLVMITWRFVCVEYEYSLEGGVLSLAKVYGKRYRTEVFSCEVRRMVLIAPNTEENRERAMRNRPERAYTAVSGKRAENVWLAVMEESEKSFSVFYFEADDELCARLRFYNPSAMTRR